MSSSPLPVTRAWSISMTGVPLVLARSLAWEWLDPDLDPARAEELAKNVCRPTEDFEWFRVGRGVGNVSNQGAQLILPLDDLP